MLRARYRFHSRGGVKHTYKQGKTIRQPKMKLVYNQNIKGGQRFAVVVSKRIFKHAVDRNRVRRRVYEAIRLNFDKFTKRQDYIVVIYSRDFKDMPFSDLEDALIQLAERAIW